MRETFPGYSAAGAAHALRCGGREAVRAALLAARARTLAWADAHAASRGLEAEVPRDERLNPLLWELGHVGWFQEWWIARNRQRTSGARCDPGHERAASLLAGADSWYDSARVPHDTRWTLPLPGEAPTRAYLARTLEQTLSLLDGLPPAPSDDALYFFRLVCLHEEMHAEAAAYMSGLLDPPTDEAPAGAPLAASMARPEQLRVPARTFSLGSPDAGFAFDNELGAHEVALGAFEIDARPVSVAQFQQFVEAGGYSQRRWWSEAGWAWREGRGAPSLRAAWNAPAVHLSAHEAEAWCRWAGRRLPTEAEWECAALNAPGFAWGGPQGVWEWTASDFEPYPGFVAHPYREYSAPWFGSRRVLRGASHATSPALAHPRYRNFFDPARSDIFAGFRSCTSIPPSVTV